MSTAGQLGGVRPAYLQRRTMRLVIDKFVHEAPGISIIPETEYGGCGKYKSVAGLSRLLSTGCGQFNSTTRQDGRCYPSSLVQPVTVGGPDRP